MNKSINKLSKYELLQIIFKQNENVELLTKNFNELMDTNKQLINTNNRLMNVNKQLI